jgi:membrane complex biogenesis BtpA family protein
VSTRLDFDRGPLLIGMVHLRALPGSPHAAPMRDVLGRAVTDARTWARGGADALLLENFGDRPFVPDGVPPATIAAMSRVLAEVARVVELPLGVNVLRNDAEAAIALAAVHDLAFVRVNVHAGVVLSDQGLLVGRAHATVRVRASLECDAKILADLRVKHAAPLVERPLVDEARELVERADADALLLTGPATGRPPDLAALEQVEKALPGTPRLLASGVDAALIAATRERVAGWIVGTAAKRGGRVEAPAELARVRALVHARDHGASGGRGRAAPR